MPPVRSLGAELKLTTSQSDVPNTSIPAQKSALSPIVESTKHKLAPFARRKEDMSAHFVLTTPPLFYVITGNGFQEISL